jgi:hypothetical protein
MHSLLELDDRMRCLTYGSYCETEPTFEAERHLHASNVTRLPRKAASVDPLVSALA